MRVLMLSWEYPPQLVGGLARHVCGLARGLVRRGVRVDVLTRAGAGAAALERDDGVWIHRVQPYFGQTTDFPGWVMHLNFALAEAGVRILQQTSEPVVLHAHDWLAAYAGRVLKHAFRLPLVATVHATEEGRMHGLHDATQKYIHDIEWWLTYEAWRVVVCSRAMRAEVQRLFGLPNDKIAVIPNGIEPVRIAMPARLESERERVVFFVGRLVPEKGAAVLLEAFPRVLQACPDVRLVIAGTGLWEGELRRRVGALGLNRFVHFTGYVDDVQLAALFARAAVVAVPSTYEPFGIVALEAMQAGAPLVVADTGGLAEIVEHGVDGRKAIPGDPGSLAQQIMMTLQNEPAARRMADAARRKVAAVYTWDGVAGQTEQLYSRVLAEWGQSSWGGARLPVQRTVPDATATSGFLPLPDPTAEGVPGADMRLRP